VTILFIVKKQHMYSEKAKKKWNIKKKKKNLNHNFYTQLLYGHTTQSPAIKCIIIRPTYITQAQNNVVNNFLYLYKQTTSQHTHNDDIAGKIPCITDVYSTSHSPQKHFLINQFIYLFYNVFIYHCHYSLLTKIHRFKAVIQ